MPLTLQIITSERIVLEEPAVDSVTLPGIEGELTILPSHAALMTELQPGPLVFRAGGVEQDVALSGGFLEVHYDRVIILADTAERSDELDAARAEAARERAREALDAHDANVDLAAALAALDRARARLRVIDRRRRRPGSGQLVPPQQQHD
jgi:F-type H+-transporting ATPase subunit epsilon